MSTGNINILVRCDECRHADAYGRGCEHGPMMPVLVFMSGKSCENFEGKTSEKIEEQLKIMHKK